ncbi:sulfhydryl oxidase 1 [Discoglossus pictus]
MMPGLGWLCVPGVVVLLLAGVGPGQAGLYSKDEPLVSLAGATRSLLLNSSSAWLAEFYATWCGHCQHFSQFWSALAEDVKDWRPVLYLGVLDCAEESNRGPCTEFGIAGYPSLKFFKPFSETPSDSIRIPVSSVIEIRQKVVDNLESSPPPSCPSLMPISANEVNDFFTNNNKKYLALIFENKKSYTGREVTLDMVQYDGISVHRVLSDQTDLVERFKVSTFPSMFLLSKNGSISNIRMDYVTRPLYTNYLRSLLGVQKKNLALIGWSETIAGGTSATRRHADGSKLYMADLESALHYSLRVEVGRLPTIEGDRLKALAGYVKVLRKYFPARPMLKTLLNYLSVWLRSKIKIGVSFKDFEDVLNNKNQAKQMKAVLAPDENYVWCEGSKPEFRGYPCSLWTLFHTLTVQAQDLARQGLTRSYHLEVLSAMREYVRHFFGCRDCAEHFESMAAESMRKVSSLDEAIMWLWDRHNSVNKRLSGAESDDPEFPKVQWPTEELCPLCRKGEAVEGDIWDRQNVLSLLKTHFAKSNIDYSYLEDEEVLLKNQKKGTSPGRSKREVGDEKALSNEEGKNIPANEDDEEKSDIDTISKDMFAHQRPRIIKMKLAAHVQPEDEEDIVDLDTFVQRKSIQNSHRAHHPETLLDPVDVEFDHLAAEERLLKRGVDTKYLIGIVMETGEVNWKGRWVKMLEVGFSRLDISLCVVLYFLSSMCLLIMYLYLSLRTRCLRPRCQCPQA